MVSFLVVATATRASGSRRMISLGETSRRSFFAPFSDHALVARRASKVPDAASRLAKR